MSYYVLARGQGELYAMNMALSEDEARRYGYASKEVPVKAVFVWTRIEHIEAFRQFLSTIQREPNTPFEGLIRDMREGTVDVLELSAGQLRDRLRQYRSTEFVAVNPGPEQTVQKIDDFLADLRPA